MKSTSFLTRITAPGLAASEDRYSATRNKGRITQYKDLITGEEGSYAYDALNRLFTASTTGPEWGLSFTYDGVGDKTAQSVTKGTGPSHSFAVDGATNRIIGVSCDANGNQRIGGGYDIMNRLQSNGDEMYGYGWDNKRLYKKQVSTGVREITFYGIGGRRLATYQIASQGSTWYFLEQSRNIYFAGKLIRTGADSVILDRLGSVRYRKQGSTTERLDYWPYGEEKPTATTQDREKFATYFRDSTDLDYADQRYFNSQHGRFLTPDPYRASSLIAKPQTWNRYPYVAGDPVNFRDRRGLA